MFTFLLSDLGLFTRYSDRSLPAVDLDCVYWTDCLPPALTTRLVFNSVSALPLLFCQSDPVLPDYSQ